jgi:uncharacterized glyoxalase superfamily protein PhnB
MSEDRQVRAEVEVAVDAGTAFRAFTEEMNLWWVRGPVNFFDAARATAMTCEPGVGGRLLEVYDLAAGDVLELGRITVWQPGEQLSWRSSVDEVRVDVRFAATATGTMVRVTATIPAGTTDQGGTAWVRVVPPWFGAYCERRTPGAPVSGATASGATASGAADTGRLAIAIYYAKPVAAAHWLASVFGLRTPGELPTEEGGRHWIEFLAGNCSVIISGLGDGGKGLAGSRPGSPPPDGTAATHVPWIFVDDLDAHFARSEAGGATIVQGIHQHGYRAYVADDPEGRRWTFAQARPTQH